MNTWVEALDNTEILDYNDMVQAFANDQIIILSVTLLQ